VTVADADEARSEIRRRAELNIARAGELLMLSAWLQGQMSDLLILQENPAQIPEFIAAPARVPTQVSAKRSTRWEMMFAAVAAEFETTFLAQLSSQEIQDLRAIGTLRNALAHAQVSMGREYLLYRPSGGAEKVRRIIETLGLKEVEDQSDPIVIKLILWNDARYMETFDMFTRLDQVCFSRISREIGVPHSRIR
jgi:hypothetical protein